MKRYGDAQLYKDTGYAALTGGTVGGITAGAGGIAGKSWRWWKKVDIASNKVFLKLAHLIKSLTIYLIGERLIRIYSKH